MAGYGGARAELTTAVTGRFLTHIRVLIGLVGYVLGSVAADSSKRKSGLERGVDIPCAGETSLFSGLIRSLRFYILIVELKP